MRPSRLGFIAAAAATGALLLAGGAGAAPQDDAAKKEGAVVWYATMNTKDMNATADAFMKSHPGIKVETLRLGSSQLPARIFTEQRAGKFNADVISGDAFQVLQLVESGAFDKYRPPETDKFIKGTVDPNGMWANLYQNTTVIAWNAQRLKADHLRAPASFADFAKPEWKGRFGFDTGALNWYMGVLQIDKSGGADLVKRIAANSPVKTSGHTQTVTSLEAGEFDATPTAYGYMADQQKRGGKPVDFLNPTPLFVSLNPVGLAKNAPHPNAAHVFIDWLLSKDGQQFIAARGGGEISSRIDVKNNPAIWDPKHPFVIIQTPSSAQYNDLERSFRAVMGLPG
ncbi:MAG TPA: extracellular solute-binding protein [Candidatus Elarobacter sp.]|jgi:iron(III) transport system substrate-binding protein|nr:extracellular solute-binding protein [Candidatus Elarobacter sp.]